MGWMDRINNWVKDDPQGDIKSIANLLLGTQIFYTTYPAWGEVVQTSKELPINRVRTWIVRKHYDKHVTSIFLDKCRSLGIAVLATVWDEDHPERTPGLCKEILHNHGMGNDLYLIEIGNETNAEISPGNRIEPDDYFDIYVECFQECRKIRNDCSVYPSGLIGSNKADIPCKEYLRTLFARGIQKYVGDNYRKSAYNLHFYYEQWDQAEGIVRLIRANDKHSPIWCTESGVIASRSKSEQEAWYRRAVQECKRLGIEQLFWYGVKHCGNPLNVNEDYALLDPYNQRRPLFNYIQSHGVNF